jgi:hypothetical protein
MAERDRRAALAIGLVVLALAACEAAGQYAASTWIQRDGRFYVNVSTTLAERGSLEQPFAASWYTGTLGWNRNLDVGWSNLALGAHGEHYPKHTWLLPLLSLPLFFALGLLGTLVFNVLVYGAAGAFSYRFARAYAGPGPSALAAVALLYATGVRENMYDYHVDPLILALGTAAMMCAAEARGAWAGTLLGVVVLMRPTALMLLPPLALVLAERRAWRALGRAMLAGSAVLTAGAMTNWAMFGRPWWSGYNRILAVVDGVPQVVDNAGSFGVPLEDGLRRTWSGAYGLRSRAPVMALAAPGLLWLLWRRPIYALAALALSAASVLVFSKYVFEGDRFHWLAFAFLLPALASTFALLETLTERVRALRRTALAAPAAVFVIAAGALLLVHAGTDRAAFLQGDEVFARLALGALLAAATCAALARVAEPALAAAVALVPLMLPGVRDALLSTADGVGGGGLLAATCAALSVAVLAHAPRDDRRSAWVAGVVAALFAGSTAWLTLDDAARALDLPGALHAPDLRALRDTLSGPGPARALLPLLLLAAPGLLVALHRDARTGAALLVLFGALLPAARPAPTSPLVALALVLPLAPLASALAARATTWLARLRTRGTLALLVTVLLVLGAIGLGRRSAEASAPFRIATPHALRLAEVRAGDVPCDFLAWEHQSWECSHIDAGLYQLTGLATSDPPRVGGARVPLFVLPTASGARTRSVTWRGVRGGRALVLDWAVPDGQRGGVTVEVALDGRTVDTFEVPLAPTARIETRTIPSPSARGRNVTLTLSVRSRGPVGLVALDGGFTD